MVQCIDRDEHKSDCVSVWQWRGVTYLQCARIEYGAHCDPWVIYVMIHSRHLYSPATHGRVNINFEYFFFLFFFTERKTEVVVGRIDKIYTHLCYYTTKTYTDIRYLWDTGAWSTHNMYAISHIKHSNLFPTYLRKDSLILGRTKKNSFSPTWPDLVHNVAVAYEATSKMLSWVLLHSAQAHIHTHAHNYHHQHISINHRMRRMCTWNAIQAEATGY